MPIRGSLDRCDDQLIEGWATLVDQPEKKLSLEAVLGDRVVGRFVADRFRADLNEAGIADGECAFSFAMPAFVPKSEIRNLAVRIEGAPLYLRPPAAGPGCGAAVRETVSRFGGLWIDRHDWLDRLAEKYRRGDISDALSARIFRFVRDGYLVIEGAVPPPMVARINDDVERLWQKPPEGLLIETFEPDGQMRYIPPDIRYRGGRTKLLDVYAFCDAAREATAAAEVVEFLTAVFEDKPKAFQGLHFWNGSQQAMHKDTAYVKVDTNPMHLAATWLALEDVEPGIGELEYYVGSHRAPDFLFGGNSKWMESHTEEHDSFLQSLHDDAERYHQTRTSFLAKAGDVLVWHADLAHGGAAITKPGRSRRSLVTHFTSAADEPFYRRNSQYREGELQGCIFTSAYYNVP
ncbi:MAG TPA: phytanoyl-CoA dioxygenase family protein [Stellaceae bacterium]|nr:phytanoyl-CoA dioxygenase family protein [Stellaceae bacterium]